MHKVNIWPWLAGVWLFSEYMRSRPAPVHYVGSIPGGYNACCIPPAGIFITRREMGNSRLLRHELEHWNQFQAMGLIGFYSRYSDEMQQYGYDLSPMEVAARVAAGEAGEALYDYTAAVRSGKAVTVHNPGFRK